MSVVDSLCSGDAKPQRCSPLALALVHHPVLDRFGAVSTTAVTNVDVHDLSRLARSYGLQRAFFVTPVSAQVELVERILQHWRPGSAGAQRNPDRAEALSRAAAVRSVDEAVAVWSEVLGRMQHPGELVAQGGGTADAKAPDASCAQPETDANAKGNASAASKPRIWATSALQRDGLLCPRLSYAGARARLVAIDAPPTLLLFGTGHGLAPELVARCDAVLEPVVVDPDYNHLSVRAATAVILDRLVA